MINSREIEVNMLLNINSKLRNIRNKFKSDKRGVTAVEYAIIAVAMSSIILFVFKDGTLKTTLNDA
ncbi:Flp family type IVb pilin, partial [Vibrio parahaemolyticus]